jgi:two-component system response regulator MprA
LTTSGYILVVDDDASIRQLTMSVFQDEGYEVRVASDGRVALSIVQNEAPRLVVLDLQMPIMDGRTFFRALRAEGYSAPVLLLSAYGAEKAKAELGADDAIEKPYDIDELLGRAQALLQRTA